MIVPARRRAPRFGNYRIRGMGATAPTPPTYETCDNTDQECVNRNVVKSNNYNMAQVVYSAAENQDQCYANAENATSDAQYNATISRCNAAYTQQSAAQNPVLTTYTPSSASAQSSSGSSPTGQWFSSGGAWQTGAGNLTFTTSRGGSNFYVGDTWKIVIEGAIGNAPVTVSGSMPGGSFSGSPMGFTRADGYFEKSGTFDASTIGSWIENWFVSQNKAGSISFTVAASPSSQTGQTIVNSSGAPAGSTGGNVGAPSSSTTTVTTTGTDTSTATPATSVTIAGFNLSSIPWWGWAAGAAAGLYFLGGHRGR